MKKNKVIGILVAVCLALLAGLGWLSYRQYKYYYPSGTYKVHKIGNVEDVQIFGDKNQFVLSKKLGLVDNRYLFSVNSRKFKASQEEKYSLNNISNQMELVSYDLENNMKKSEFNFLNTIGQGSFDSNRVSVRISENYANTIQISVSSDSIKYYYYNLETNQLYTPSDSNKSNDAYSRIPVVYTNLQQRIAELGYYYNSNNNGINNPNREKHELDINLFNEHSDFNKKLDDGYVLYIRSNLVTEEEIFNTLLHWFAPTGESTLSGVQINAEYSKDGQAHEIHSYAEFQQYFQAKRGS